MLVVVIVMFRMPVAIVDIVNVIAMPDLFMGTVMATVPVLSGCVLGAFVMLIVVVLVFSMAVAIMQVVDVVTVPDRFVCAVASAVAVLRGAYALLCFLRSW